ncbi:D-TA family PLP-dependent enzyme [Bacillus suaedaesalsae]|uniref:D-TA family PLP-dependent enzyme n=1 Tax=Bacillus suaedaesalsae TaxID=2810349 RepID=A0ABS2DDN9_9BACI|nr:D-TA family PLP-dependent enzyme [Bacillus suaedaesalsae]MBM6616546.1 D-TA family PLP-dependent enzyme [Bacillus suaedaesalsae]
MSSIFELDTPTLLLDKHKMQRNLEDIFKFARQNGLSVRPHSKTHKSGYIAELQQEAGAVGITTAKIGEAEVMAHAGIRDILIAYPVSSSIKIERLIHLLRNGTRLKIAVDQKEQLHFLQKGLEHCGEILEVWIKVNSGLNRCGVNPGKEVLSLAEQIQLLPNLKLGGIFTHAGHSYAAVSVKEIEKIGKNEGLAVSESAKLCEVNGIPIPVRSVGSTPTYKIAGKVNGITEIRPGNAIFFDMIQVGLGVTTLENCALSVLASVVGVYNNRIVVDTGSKILCLDKGAHGNTTVNGFGHIVGHPNLLIERLSEEHGIVSFTGDHSLKLNDKVRIIPNHACVVVNQNEEYVVHQQNCVLETWKVDARGKVK